MWPTMPSVIVVGGGIAGISAADYLVRHGIHDVKILEATDRTGGRIWSVDVDDNLEGKAELGANYIHGIERNPIFKIADQNHLLELRNADKGLRHKIVYATEGGGTVNKQIVQEVDWTYGMLMQQCEEYYQLDLPTAIENDSVGAFMEREFMDKIEKYSEEDRHIRMQVFQQRLAYEAVVSGSDTMHEVSLSELGSYEELPGIHYTIPPGFEAVLDILKQSIPSDGILLNHPVKCIYWSGNNDAPLDNQTQCCVECENGKKFYADHVIVTVSLGCLKHNAKRFFSPSIPQRKLDAISKLAFGLVGKVILEFDEPVFDHDLRRLELLWDRNHHNDQDTDLANSWFKKVFSFEMIQENVLLGWLSGKECEYMESLTEEKVAADCVAVLERFLNKSIPKPKKVIRSSWGTNQYQRGSYSYIPIGATVADIESLAEPLPLNSNKPELLFAGEATHPSFYSTTHGALLTGQSAAERILNVYTEAVPEEPDTDSDDDQGLMF